MTDYILKMKEITKKFPGVKALDHVDFDIKAGEVHSLMGENGAGKSTLIKILTGVYKKDSGIILFNGKERNFSNTLEAQNAGISTVYQELNMIPFLSVAENIFLGRYPTKKSGIIDWEELFKDAREVLQGMELDIDEKRALDDYGVATRQIVAIARAISLQCKLIVLDEPTSSLDAKEVNILFRIIAELKVRGIAFIFITHRLNEVYRISDRITVLKDGHRVGTYLPKDLNYYDLIAKMVGHSSTEQRVESRKKHSLNGRAYIVEMSNIYCKPKLKNINLKIREGEIVGIAGLLGAGRTETAQVLFGYDCATSGQIKVYGSPVQLKSPKDGVAHHFAFCTENRREEGVIPNMSVRDNILISSMKQVCAHGFIDPKKENEIVSKYVEKLHIKTPNLEQNLKNLSGGKCYLPGGWRRTRS